MHVDQFVLVIQISLLMPIKASQVVSMKTSQHLRTDSDEAGSVSQNKLSNFSMKC